MNLEKLHGALAQMSAALEDKSGPKGPAQPPVQPGQMMWNSDVILHNLGLLTQSVPDVSTKIRLGFRV